MNVLILSAYDAQSHRRWHLGLVKHLPFEFSVMTLPPRYFAWRIRGNALTWAMAHKAELLAKPWDVIVATSMVDLASLKGLVPELAQVPTLLYFHENQFAYPQSVGQATINAQIEPQMVSLYGALAADKIAFNSNYNKKTFLQGAQALLKKLPDHVPKNIPACLEDKSVVLPVPLEPSCFSRGARACERGEGPLTVVWNHRWEYDKGPDLLLAIVQLLAALAPTLALRFHIVGEQFRQMPASFNALNTLLNHCGWSGEWGYLPCDQYRAVLHASDIVLSTALHDFQGLAVMDAVAAGCTPLLPARLAYPDFFAAPFLYEQHNNTGNRERTTDDEALAAAQKIIAYARGDTPMLCPDLHNLSWTALARPYSEQLRRLAVPC
ncbi:MAG TPA: DUF3524 domain-containing protein [Marinagarivorans sp.]